MLRDPTAHLTKLRARLGDTFVLDGLGYRLFFVFSAAGVRALYAAPEHEASFGLERLYDVCKTARRLCDRLNIGRIIARPGTFMFNAPGALHGGISRDLTLYIHCCNGKPDDIVSIDLIDFEPAEQL